MRGLRKTHTTPYHPRGNGVVERGNRDLGDSLRALLIGADEEEWDLLLPQIMRGIRAVQHHTTGETPNFLTYGRELRLPDTLVFGSSVEKPETRETFAVKLQNRLHKAHQALRQQQFTVREGDFHGEPAYKAGDYVMMVNKRVGKNRSSKLAPKFVGPYKILQAFPNHTYELARDGQSSIESETRLKAFHGPQGDKRAEAPVLLEPK